ncbi:MAG: phosphatase PAP2 family protein [Firmicutes bacterium]|nr:phosphatase PAP2 family protein [Bacillota bacterium]
MEYLLELQNLRDASPAMLNYFFLGISEFISVGGIFIAAYIYWCLSKRAGAYILFCFSGGYMLNQIIKNTACIYRPWIADPRIHLAEQAASSATGYSFPSGHTLSATAVYGSTGIYMSKNKLFVAFMALMIVLTAFARNWLGAHTLLDVSVAVLEGVIVLIINALIISWLVKKDESYGGDPYKDKRSIRNRAVLMVIGLIFIIVSMIYIELKPYPMDYDASGNILVEPYKMITDCYTGAGMFSGFLIGWFIERRFIDYHLPYEKSQRGYRFVFGALGLIILYIAIAPLITIPFDSHISHLIKYFLVFFWVSGGYPALVKWQRQRLQRFKREDPNYTGNVSGNWQHVPGEKSEQ